MFIDNDISAFSGKFRPSYRDMLSRLAETDKVLAWHTDRLYRQPSELEEFMELCIEHSVFAETVQTGPMDLSTAAGIFAARMFVNIASYESQIKAARVKRAMEQKIRAGQFTGGPIPWGWNLEDGIPVLDEPNADIIRGIFRDVISGRSLGSIVRGLNDRGVKTGAGKSWGYAQLRQVLLRPRNAGLSSLHGEIVGESEFPAIVSEDVWLAVRSILEDPSRRRSQSNKAVHLLAGIAQCHCGALLRSASATQRNGEVHRIYRCPVRGKGHVSKRIEYVDSVVNPMMVAYSLMAARSQRAADDSASEEAEALELEVKALRQRLYDLTMQAAEGVITGNQLGLITSRINDKIADAEAKIADAAIRASRPRVPGIMPSVSMDSPEGKAWLDKDIDDRRDFVRLMCNVVLLPHGATSTKVFNPDTVRIVLKNVGDAPGPLTVEEIEKMRNAVKMPVEDFLLRWPEATVSLKLFNAS